MKRHDRTVKVVRLKQLYVNPEKQAEFTKALYTTGHWAKCPECGQPKYVVSGFIDSCQKCSHKEPEQGV